MLLAYIGLELIFEEEYQNNDGKIKYLKTILGYFALLHRPRKNQVLLFLRHRYFYLFLIFNIMIFLRFNMISMVFGRLLRKYHFLGQFCIGISFKCIQ